MSGTRRWKFVEQQAQRLMALGLKPSEIAAEIGVDKSTVTRKIAEGTLKKPEQQTVPSFTPPPARQSPAEWAKSVRDEFMLSSTDEQLVTLAESALSRSRDITASASVQLAAGREFRAYAKQLDLLPKKAALLGQQQPQVVNGGPTEPVRTSNPPVRRRSTADPRNGLRSVK